LPRPLTNPMRFGVILLARVAFTAASLIVAWGVFKPATNAVGVFPWDKAEHFTAFFGLMFLGVVAFPRLSLLRLGVALSAAGALIEVIQATPLVNRDADVMDWVADTLGILAVAGSILAARLRRELI
jgi:VanZ family protein